MTDLTKIFKERLRHYRDLRGLSQQALADRVQLSTVYIAEMELGNRTPSFATLESLANALQIEPYQLLIVLDEDQQTLLADFLKTVLAGGERVLMKGFGPIKSLEKEKPDNPVTSGS
jgi:transcriptional regulator with XRE-family HTH domain